MLAPLLEVLVARGARIVVAADHGEVLLEERCGRQHERSVSDHVLRVPLMRWEPGREPAVHDDWVGLMDVPSLLEGNQPAARAGWLAESGLCEPGCAPGCAPAGLRGRDRVAIAPTGRLRLRAGQGRSTGTVPEALRSALEQIPAVPLPGAADEEEAAILGYTQPAP